MGRMLSGLGLWTAYLALATLLSELVVLGMLFTSGRLDGARLAQIMAIVQGVELVPATERGASPRRQPLRWTGP